MVAYSSSHHWTLLVTPVGTAPGMFKSPWESTLKNTAFSRARYVLVKKKENISTGVTSPNLIFRAGDKPRGAMGPMAEDVWELTRAPLWAAAWQESCFTKAWVSEKLDPLQFKEENVLRAPKSTLLKYIFIFLFPPKRGSCSAASALLHGTLGREGSAALHSSTR